MLAPTVKASLKRSSDPRFLERQLKLRLNRLAKRLLNQQGSLEVCVRVQVTLKRRVLFEDFRVVTVR